MLWEGKKIIEWYSILELFNSSNFDLVVSFNLFSFITFGKIFILNILLKISVFDNVSKNVEVKSISWLNSYKESSLLSKLL